MTKQYLKNKSGGYGLHRSPIEEEWFLPEDKMVSEAIK